MRYVLVLTVASIASFIGCLRSNVDKSWVYRETSRASRVELGFVRLLRNTDVRWDGNVFGLMPRAEGTPADELLKGNCTNAIPLLVAALSEKEKYIAAHVLLTVLSGVKYNFN